MDDTSKACPVCGYKLGGRWGNRCYRCKGRPRTGEVRQCRTCGKDFPVPQWKLDDAERNQGVYCSRTCKHEALLLPPSVPIHMSEVAPGSIQCNRCGIVKRADDFGADLRKRNGKKSSCKACNTETVAEWRQKFPERYAAMKKIPRTERQRIRRRDLGLQQMYGMTLLDYERTLAEQNGGCGICGSSPNGNGPSGKHLHVDHDHACCSGVGSCGKCIRGLLCGRCNTMIGLAKDDPGRLLAATRYLQRYKT